MKIKIVTYIISILYSILCSTPGKKFQIITDPRKLNSPIKYNGLSLKTNKLYIHYYQLNLPSFSVSIYTGSLGNPSPKSVITDKVSI